MTYENQRGWVIEDLDSREKWIVMYTNICIHEKEYSNFCRIEDQWETIDKF